MTTVEHDYQIGDFLCLSWGYEQTNINFYQIVGVTAKSVKIKPVKSEIVEFGDMTGEVIPVKDGFTTDIFIKDGKTARVGRYGIRIESGYTAHKWDGRPERFSTYA